MEEANTDHGSVIPKEAAAFYTMPDGSMGFLIPKEHTGKEAMPNFVALICAFAILSTDADWVAETIDRAFATRN